MAEQEKPLHVKVAEALGWTDCIPIDLLGLQHWAGVVPSEGDPPPNIQVVAGIDYVHRAIIYQATVPRYDTDWSATGPLIERYRITVRPTVQSTAGTDGWTKEEKASLLQSWDALLATDWARKSLHGFEVGATPLLSVCNLILVLHAAGKLHDAVE